MNATSGTRRFRTVRILRTLIEHRSDVRFPETVVMARMHMRFDSAAKRIATVSSIPGSQSRITFIPLIPLRYSIGQLLSPQSDEFRDGKLADDRHEEGRLADKKRGLINEFLVLNKSTRIRDSTWFGFNMIERGTFLLYAVVLTAAINGCVWLPCF